MYGRFYLRESETEIGDLNCDLKGMLNVQYGGCEQNLTTKSR